MFDLKRRPPLDTRYRLIIDYIYVLIGSSLIGIAFNVFLLPNKVASGGVSGISTILHWTFGWEPSFVQWFFNIPLFISGVIFLGSSFGYFHYAVKTFTGTAFLPFVVFLTSHWGAATHNPLLAAIFGGLGIGLGLGIVFRGNASTGGTDLVAQIVHKYTGAPLGICVLTIDGCIVILSAFTLSLESALYALIAMFITAKTIDMVQMGLRVSKMALIISEKESELKSRILAEIDRGVTRISGYGGYTDDERPMLLCVVSQNEITRLKLLVREVDPKAFVVVTPANEVLGEGFKRHS